jgi:radical SAM superfamily enzyme YgiQ (UPF0313 family)
LASQKPRALFINPPVYDFALYDLYLKPFGLLRLAQAFENAGYEITFINALDYHEPADEREAFFLRRKKTGTGKFLHTQLELPEKLLKAERGFYRYGYPIEKFETDIKKAEADIILVTSSMTYWYKGVEEAVQLCRKHHPSVTLVLGGIYATLMPEHASRLGADFTVKGEALPLLNSLLEKLKLPAISLEADNRLYADERTLKDAAVVRLNTGCPFFCAYCASKAVSGCFKPGQIESAVASVVEMNKRFGTRNFAFYDDALLAEADTVLKPFLEKIISLKRDLNFYLPNAVHIKYLDEEILKLMYRAGFKELRLGYESSDDSFHDERGVKYNTGDLENRLKLAEKAGFKRSQVYAYILAGLPGQNSTEVEASVRSAALSGVKISIAEFSPVPGSLMWEECVEKSVYPIAEEPLYQNNSFFPMEWEGFTADDLAALKKKVRAYNAGLF